MMETGAPHTGRLIGGLILIGLGAVLLLGQFVGGAIWGLLWPLFIIAVGVLFFLGMFTRGRGAGGFAIPGSILTVLGLILLYQNAFNYWASWAYAWALITPTAIGLGLAVMGWRDDRPVLRQIGLILVAIGLVVFVLLGAFFELLVNLAGFATPGRFLWPAALILVGVLLLFGQRLFLRWLPVSVRELIIAAPPVKNPSAELPAPVPPPGNEPTAPSKS